MKIKRIKDDSYYRSIYLISNAKMDEFDRYFKKKYPLAEDIDFPQSDARFFAVVNEDEKIEDYYVFIDEFDWTVYDMALIAHEVLHLCFLYSWKVGDEVFG